MPISTIDDSQRAAAKVAGIAFLVTNATAMFAEFYVNSRLIVTGDGARTFANIAASQTLFRLGIASHLFTCAAVVALIVALYVILRPVNRNLALLALSLRLVETAVFAASVLPGFDVLRLVSGAPYLRGFAPDSLQALTMLSLSAHGAAYVAGLLLFGLGSAVFCYLFYTSNYIPRLLAGLGVFGSVLTSACMFAVIIFPDLSHRLVPGCFAPIFIFEVVAGFWLLIKGLAQPSPTVQ